MVADAAGMMSIALMCEGLACWLFGGIFRSTIDVKGCSVCVCGVTVYVGNQFSSMESVWAECDEKLFHAYILNASKHMSTIHVLSMSHRSTILGKRRRS